MYPKPILTTVHKKSKHLTLEERFLIQFLHRRGSSPYAIAKEIGCAANTVRNEIKRGIIEYNIFGQILREYSGQTGQQNYLNNCKNCDVRWKLIRCSDFIRFAEKRFWTDKWSFDASVGYARVNKKFLKEEIPDTKSMYNWTNAGLIDVKKHELPEAISRKARKKVTSKEKRKLILGKNIEERPAEADDRMEFGH